MKKPFFKKTSGYLDRIQAEYDQLKSQHDKAQKALVVAIAEHEAKTRARVELEARTTDQRYLSDTEIHYRKLQSEAENVRRQLEYQVRDLNREMCPLWNILSAPSGLEEAKSTLRDLSRRQEGLSAEYEKTATQISKVEKRIAQLEEQVASETKVACLAMAESDGDFTVPDSLGKVEVALRLARTTLAELQQQSQRISDQQTEVHAAIKAARGAIVSYRETVAEIELQEQLPAFIDIIARAAVSRHISNMIYRDDRYEITIPNEVVESMRGQLNAELVT
jgi:hypothetical protein